mgnify:CR=1 FL=1
MGLFRKKSLREQEHEIKREEIYWNAEKVILERKQKLREEKREMRKSKKMSTTKFLIGFLLNNKLFIYSLFITLTNFVL